MRGMTITEIVIAVVLIALSIGGILTVLTQNTSIGQSVDYAYVATNVAKSRIERLREIRRDRGYADLINWQESDVIVDRNGLPDPNGDFKRTTVVNPNFSSNLTEVTVRVRYKRGAAFTSVPIELVTLISAYY